MLKLSTWRTLITTSILLISWSVSAASSPPVIAAASDLQFALTEVAEDFTQESGQRIKLAFGSSGLFYRQIMQGGPFELYLSADEAYVERLAANGMTQDAGTLYALGRLALVIPDTTARNADEQLADMREGNVDNSIQRFAIANPEHAPYGQRAEEALRHIRLWDILKDRLVLGENVSQAAQFVASGNAQAGIVAYSLALAPALQEHTSMALLPAAWHQPLRQRMVLTNKAGPVSEAFYHYMQTPAARAVMQRYGFDLNSGE
ncbi:molybdate ABC transporter substrate-binding protein [Halopseudomonas sp.]|jgi:molybdate transport system substrate-binding protein|uniref:molybdate ABC transporter substrate-binding protein n=1 Tax=Halopseudomonas sp. TaxID=2901191 RepID=UPI001B7C1AC5|nr:molybdate ABC transporter substrate-binding protein [Pseudomonas sp.]